MKLNPMFPVAIIAVALIVYTICYVAGVDPIPWVTGIAGGQMILSLLVN